MEQSVLDIFSLFPKMEGTTETLAVAGEEHLLELEPLNNLDMLALEAKANSDAEKVFYAGLYGIAEDGVKISVKYKDNWNDVLELYTDRVPYAETRRLGETVLALTNGTYKEPVETETITSY